MLSLRLFKCKQMKLQELKNTESLIELQILKISTNVK